MKKKNALLGMHVEVKSTGYVGVIINIGPKVHVWVHGCGYCEMPWKSIRKQRPDLWEVAEEVAEGKGQPK